MNMEDMKYYDEEERELIEGIEANAGKVIDIPNMEEEKGRYKEIFEQNFTKRKAISLRILERDLLDLKGRALADGIPYQSLINAILHRYLKGSLISKK